MTFRAKISWWRAALLGGYYHGTRPWRRRWNARAAAAGHAPIIVLFYHRVSDDLATPWTVSNAMFVRHIRWLQGRFDLVSYEEAQRRVRGPNPRPAVHVTFDDGYADNCQQALPLLIKERIPCTYFVTSGCVLQGLPFRHDLALGVRSEPNTVEQLRELASAGVEIGAHTRTHADLGAIDEPARLRDEVVVAGEELQAAVGRSIRYFAFPFGQHKNLNRAAFDLAYEAGYEGVCSAYGGYNFPGDDPFHLQRIHVDNDLIRLKNWATIDPRKLDTPRFEYQPRPVSPPLAEAWRP